MATVELKVDGMSCASCVASVTRALQRVPGVGTVDVDLARGVARVDGDVGTTPAMLSALEAAGYAAALSGEPTTGGRAPVRSGGCGSGGSKGPGRGGCCCG